jgi:DNA-binding MarR family transcriptional regulator
MVIKGRSAKGEAHSQSKLTAAQVIAIRAEYQTGTILQKDLAAKYGVRPQTISRVIRGLRWRHLDGAISHNCRFFTPQARVARHA